eukprot:1370422-Amorphochlora_amoeboformis.AAC.2
MGDVKVKQFNLERDQVVVIIYDAYACFSLVPSGSVRSHTSNNIFPNHMQTREPFPPYEMKYNFINHQLGHP